MSATMPPHRVLNFVHPFGIRERNLKELRSSTNRPEIGMHVVQVPPIAALKALRHLVNALCRCLINEERMLVFFSSQAETETFAESTHCAIYHSDLWKAGNTKAYNLDLWDRGESKVMACTTAFAHGIHRPAVRHVVIFRPSYGLLTNNQMLGRAGRDNKKSHVFFVTDQTGIRCVGKGEVSKNKCEVELEDLIHGDECRRFTNMICMDGHELATRCNEMPHGVPCDICAPASEMQSFALKAVQDPTRPFDDPPQSGLSTGVGGSTLHGGAHAADNKHPKNTPSAFVPASSLLDKVISTSVSCRGAMICCCIHPLTQGPSLAKAPSADSDDMYDLAVDSQLTLSQSRLFDALEAIHRPVSQSLDNKNPVSGPNITHCDCADIRLEPAHAGISHQPPQGTSLTVPLQSDLANVTL
jgi:hypothetical protein